MNLRMVAEAKNQLTQLLINAGFPEECCAPTTQIDATGHDDRLDVMTSLLTYGLCLG